MVSVAIKCEACICQEIHDGLLLTSGMFIHIFNEEEMNDINWTTLLLCMQNKYWVVLNFTNVEPVGTWHGMVPVPGTTGHIVRDHRSLIHTKCINTDSIKTTTTYVKCHEKTATRKKRPFVRYFPQMIKLHSKFNIVVLDIPC